MRLLLAGGGTGGHLFPAVALAQRLLKEDENGRVLFVGTARGLEQRMLPKLGLPLATVDMVGVVGRGWRGRLELIPRLTKSLIQAFKILNKFDPEIVIGVGGYASVPVLLAAKLRGTPYVIHEQNAIPGLSNRLLGRWAKLICLSFPDRDRSFQQDRTRVTGNPLRDGFSNIDKQVHGQTLLVFGGSRGARAINQAVVGMLPQLKTWDRMPKIIHQTGEEDYRDVEKAYRAAGFDEARVVPFIDDMVTAYEEASLVICRAGATTLAELIACGRPSILIPFPFAAGDHQTENAKMLESRGAAKVMHQRDMTSESLARMARELFDHPDALQRMADNGRKLSSSDAAGDILNECRALLGRPVLEVE